MPISAGVWPSAATYLPADDGMAKLERQKRATRLRTWTDRDTGMWCLRGEFDPEAGLLLDRKLQAMVDSLFHDKTPETAPTSTSGSTSTVPNAWPVATSAASCASCTPPAPSPVAGCRSIRPRSITSTGTGTTTAEPTSTISHRCVTPTIDTSMNPFRALHRRAAKPHDGVSGRNHHDDRSTQTRRRVAAANATR
jgi:hypothetical protein